MDLTKIEKDLNNSLRLLPGIILAGVVLILFCQIGPGDDFFGAYRVMVFEPEKYSNTNGIYSPAWLASIMAPFVTMPDRKGYYLFTALTIAGIYLTVRVFNGKLAPALFSAQMFWILWWGQIDGLAILGITIGWLALERRSIALMVCGILLATVKPQIGLIPIMAILWWSEPKVKWTSLGVAACFGLLSLFIWGMWPIWIVNHITGLVNTSGYGAWNISFGLYALPLYLPAILVPLNRKERLLALTATTLLVSPYMPFYSSMILLCMGIPWWTYIFAFTGFLPNIVGTQWAWKIILLLPVLVLGKLYWPWTSNAFLKLAHKFFH